jgi:glycosyltransferase involved in cell wall biosynthesis
MKIAMVSPGYPPTTGGVETVVAQSARALVRLGHRVDVLAGQRRGDLPATELDGGVVVRRFRSTRSATFPVTPSLWAYVRGNAHRYDVIHGHGYHTLTAVGAAAAAPSATFVYTPHYHGTGHTPARAVLHTVYRPIGQYGFRRAAKITCVSRAEARLVAEHFPFARDRITVVPNAVDVDAISAARPIADDGVPTVLSVGRLERYKRIDRLIEAFALLPEPARLVIIGAGPDAERLAALSAATDGRHEIRMLGRVDDHQLHGWYQTARVVCSLSEHEAFGLVPREALAAGAGLVLSDIPAHAEIADLPLPEPVRFVAGEDSPAQVALAIASVLRAGPKPDVAPVDLLRWDAVAARLADLYLPGRCTV